MRGSYLGVVDTEFSRWVDEEQDVGSLSVDEVAPKSLPQGVKHTALVQMQQRGEVLRSVILRRVSLGGDDIFRWSCEICCDVDNQVVKQENDNETSIVRASQSHNKFVPTDNCTN